MKIYRPKIHYILQQYDVAGFAGFNIDFGLTIIDF